MPFFQFHAVFILHTGWEMSGDVQAGKALLNEAFRRQMNTYAFGSQVTATRAAAERGIRSVTPQSPVLYRNSPIAVTDNEVVLGLARAATIDKAGNVAMFAQLLSDDNFAVFDFSVQRNLHTPTVADYLKLQPRQSNDDDMLADGQAAGIAVAATLIIVAIAGVVVLRLRQRRLQPAHDFTKNIAALPLTSRPYEAPLELSFRSVREQKQLGKGAFGAVFAGTFKRNKQVVPVALKRIEVLGQPEVRERVLKEMVVLAQFRREPYIVHLEGVMTRGNTLTIVMELCERGSLGDYLKSQLRRGKSECWPVKFRMARDVSRGMAKIHASSILHLDLAARNVLLKADGTCKVADFGGLGVGGGGGYCCRRLSSNRSSCVCR